VTIKRDTGLPTVTITTPKNNGTYALGAVIIADYTCSDAVSGIDTNGCAGPVAAGAPIDTSSVGQKTFAVVGIDVAGNSKTVQRTYTVQ
jgi:hypothetical protein